MHASSSPLLHTCPAGAQRASRPSCARSVRSALVFHRRARGDEAEAEPPAGHGARLARAAARCQRLPGRSLRSPRAAARRVRALRGPAPFLGSHAIAISPDGRNVYVASSKSNAIAIFTRDARTGALTPALRARPAASPLAGAEWLRDRAVGLDGPQLGRRQPRRHRTSTRRRWAATRSPVFRRNPSTGALTQLGGGAGCIANAATPGCIDRPRARRPRRRRGQPRRAQRLRRRVQGQLGRGVHPRPRRPARSPSRPTPRGCIVDTRTDRRLRHRRSRSAIPRAWRSAPTATTCTSPPRSATPSTRSAATPPPAR